jgi:hypothetical protein
VRNKFPRNVVIQVVVVVVVVGPPVPGPESVDVDPLVAVLEDCDTNVAFLEAVQQISLDRSSQLLVSQLEEEEEEQEVRWLSEQEQELSGQEQGLSGQGLSDSLMNKSYLCRSRCLLSMNEFHPSTAGLTEFLADGKADISKRSRDSLCLSFEISNECLVRRRDRPHAHSH